MITRYWGQAMQMLWEGSFKKFSYWLLVECAVLEARETLGQIPRGTSERVKKATWMNGEVVGAIERRDREIRHDLNAFVEIMRLQIMVGTERFCRMVAESDSQFNDQISNTLAEIDTCKDAAYFHDGMTSYDTEEPAMALLIQDSCNVINDGLQQLLHALLVRMQVHKGQVMMGRTHGQHAQPITFGVKVLHWYDMVHRAAACFAASAEQAKVMKLSGAVGMYGTLEPAVEKQVGVILSLRPVVATQIVALDYRARVVSELAFIAAILEKIANDLWLMSQSEVGEVREAFGKRQKGSSAMPHKKNPITLENIRGCAAVVRGYATTMMELIATSHERDISHSAPERLVVPDALGIVDHQLRVLMRVIKDMEVFPERMVQNLHLTHGVFASQRLEMLLKACGMNAETAYRKVQEACAAAMAQGRNLHEVILEDAEVGPLVRDNPEYATCFDASTWVKEENYIYDRTLLLNKKE